MLKVSKKKSKEMASLEVSNASKIVKNGYCLKNRCFHDVFVLRVDGHYEFVLKKRNALVCFLISLLVFPVPVLVGGELMFYHLGWLLVARSINNNLTDDGFFDGCKMVMYGKSSAGSIMQIISDLVKDYNQFGIEKVVTFTSFKDLILKFPSSSFSYRKNYFSYLV